MRKPNLKTADADELVKWIRYQIRMAHGDEVENKSTVFAQKGGWYHMVLMLPDYPEGLTVGPFQRKGIPPVVDLIRSMKETAS